LGEAERLLPNFFTDVAQARALVLLLVLVLLLEINPKTAFPVGADVRRREGDGPLNPKTALRRLLTSSPRRKAVFGI
jgi:hypothetical protein